VEWFLRYFSISAAMFKNPNSKVYLGFGFASALIYCIPVYFFVQKSDYTQSWLLYLGNFLFMASIGIFIFYIIRPGHSTAGTFGLIIISQKQVLRSLVPAVAFSFILLIILIPGLFEHGVAGKYMINKPANTIHDKTNGLDFMVIANAAIGNFVTGSFVSLLLPTAMKIKGRRNKNQAP
jgi:hypothetical protein